MDSFNLKLERIGSAKEAIKTSLVNKGMSPSDNIEDYAQIIDSIEAGSSEGIKQFATVQEMQADPNAQEGDLAIVYRSETQNATVDSKFQTATFPDTVVLDTAITDYVEVRYRAVDSSKMFECMGSLDSSRFMMDCYADSGSIRIEYTSSDGITYIRTDTTGNPVDFGTEIYTEYWNDAIGKFIQVGKNTFEGLYVYSELKDGDYILLHTTTGRTLKMPNVTVFGSDWVLMNRDIVVIVVGETDENNRILSGTAYTDYPFNEYNVAVNNGNLTTSRDVSGGFGYGYVFTCDYQNNKILVPDGNFDGGLLPYNAETEYATNCNIYSDTTYTSTLFESTYQYEYEYTYAPTQLTATPDYVYEKEFYGKNGVETGTLQNTENLTKDGVKRRVNMWSSYKSGIVCPSDSSDTFKGCTNLTAIPLLDTGNVTNMSSMFGGCTNLTTIPLLNTSNVVYMNSMFMDCTNLTEIPLLDTSNATGMYGIFTRCTNLTEIPLLDTSNATNTAYMFSECANLTEIPLLDTSNVTTAHDMFKGCTNLTEIPLLNTSKVTNMSYMFQGCTNLTTIPLLNTSNVTSMYIMFEGCTSLSDESLNNILAMCKNATSYTDTKKLKRIGLTSEQANKCKTLSNYSAFTSAGWATGY